MKNKIRCLFEKINKFIHSVRFLDDVLPLITVAAVIFSTVLCMWLSLISASAAELPFAIRITRTVDGVISIVPGVEVYALDNTGAIEFLDDQYTEFASYGYIGYIQVREYDGDYYFNGEYVNLKTDIEPGLYGILLSIVNADYQVGPSQDTPCTVGVDYTNGIVYTIGANNFVTYDDGAFFTVHCLEYIGGDSTQCPTLQEQISNYNGSWTDFLMMLRQNNRTLANSYQNNIDLAIQSGAASVTLGQRLEEFEGDFDDLMEGLRISNPRLYEQYNELIDSTLQQGIDLGYSQGYNEGYYIGEENGYKNGYNSGLNKGQSDTFTKHFFTDFLGGVVEAIDSIHLYEHIREIDGGVSTVVEWYISPWTIFTSMICLIVVIIILKVWLGG